MVILSDLQVNVIRFIFALDILEELNHTELNRRSAMKIFREVALPNSMTVAGRQLISMRCNITKPTDKCSLFFFPADF
jgi:hypothetical protein